MNDKVIKIIGVGIIAVEGALIDELIQNTVKLIQCKKRSKILEQFREDAKEWDKRIINFNKRKQNADSDTMKDILEEEEALMEAQEKVHSALERIDISVDCGNHKQFMKAVNEFYTAIGKVRV